ncbi:MAG: hypothetical protein ACTSRP_00295 [Candidatus Helarchaeota archaeon]
MNDIQIIDFIAISFWICVIIVLFMISGYLFYKYTRDPDRNKIQLSFFLVFLFIGIGRILLVYFDYNLIMLDVDLYSEYQIYWKIATIFQLAGFGFLFLVTEYAVFKNKDYYIFFWGFLITTIVGMLIQDFTLSQVVVSYALVFAAFIPLSYIYLAIKMPGESKKWIIIMFIGVVIFALSLLILMVNFVDFMKVFLGNADIIHYIYLVSPVIQILGVIIFANGIYNMYFKKKDF